MSYFFLLPVGAWLFNVGAVLVARILQHRWGMGNPGPGFHGNRVVEYFGRFITYDAAKLGVESWMVAVAVILIAAVEQQSQLRSSPPALGGSVVLGSVLLGVVLVVVFGATLTLWIYLDGHRGSRWWEFPRGGVQTTTGDRLKWVLGLSVSGVLGMSGLVIAGLLA